MTIPELFEKRFGPRIRWAAGVVIVLGGLLNMGVFLRITGEFLVLVGGFDLDNLERNVVVMMTVLLLLGTIYTVVGGMLSVLVTDFLQFIVMSAGLIAVTILILTKIGWDRLAATVTERYGAGGFNPFALPRPGMAIRAVQCAGVPGRRVDLADHHLASVGGQGREDGATDLHAHQLFLCLPLSLAGHLGHCRPGRARPRGAQDPAAHLPGAKQFAVCHAAFLSQFVPVGLMGLLLAAMLAADMSSTSSYMITWGSVIYNDILAPLRKTPWSEKRGLLWNRAIVSLIGVFLLFYGLWYPLKGDVYAYLLVTGTIYLASISTMLIACCYWKRANNWGATGAIIVGAVIPIACLVIEQVRNMYRRRRCNSGGATRASPPSWPPGPPWSSARC